MSSAVRALWLGVLVREGLGAKLLEEAMMMSEAKKVVLLGRGEKPGFARNLTGLLSEMENEGVVDGIPRCCSRKRNSFCLYPSQNVMAVKLSVGSFRA